MFRSNPPEVSEKEGAEGGTKDKAASPGGLKEILISGFLFSCEIY